MSTLTPRLGLVLAGALLGLALAGPAAAEPPAAIPNSSHDRANATFESFAKTWMKQMEKAGRSQPRMIPTGAAFRDPSDEFQIETKATGRPGSPFVGILRYQEEQLHCDRDGGNCRSMGKTPITEIFRFKNGRWIY